MSMNEPGVVDKVAGRISLDITPAQQAMLTLGADYQRMIQRMVANGGMEQLAQLQTNAVQSMAASEAESKARIEQFTKNSNMSRLILMSNFYQESENRQKLFEQKYLQNEEMFQQRLGQAMARSSSASGSANGFHVSAAELAKDMLLWDTFSVIFENVRQGLVDVGKSAAGLQQVFDGNIQTQGQLNEVTNQFIEIAKRYGASVDEVLQAGKLWGRQYSEQVSEVLTGNSTLLSIVDNLSVTDANKAVESSMQALGLQVTNTTDAMTKSMKIIDSWTAVSHSTSVSTKDLADGFERAAASAKQVGINVDQLSALVAAGVRNSGRTGTVVGNMWKSVLDNIASGSTKVQDAFAHLGINMYTVGANGQKQLRPIWDILQQLSQAAEHSTVAQTKYFSAIAGGKYQFDTLRAAVTDLTTIQNAYNASLNSAGTTSEKAQAQMHTLAAELQRLRDTIQQMAFNAGSGGFGDMLKGLVVGLTDFINGLQKIPASVDWTVAGFAGLLIAGKSLVGLMNTFHSVTNLIVDGFKFWGNAASNVAGSLIALAGPTTALTADLEAKTLATQGAVAADGEQVIAAGATTVALDAETVAAGEATTAWIALDTASGGLALAVGAAIAGFVGLVTVMGSYSRTANDAANATKKLNDEIKQSQQNAQQDISQTTTQINQLQQLKQQYADVTRTLAQAQAGSQAYKQAQADLADIQQQMIGIVGAEKTAEIMSSKDKIKAWNDEIQAMINVRLSQVVAENNRLQTEQTFTTGFIALTNQRIGAIANEAEAQARADYLKQNHGQFAYDTMSVSPPTAEYDERAIQHQMWLGAKAQQAIDMNGGGGGPLANQINQLEQMKRSLMIDPNKVFGNISSGSGGMDVASANVAKAASSLSDYLSKIVEDLRQGYDQERQLQEDALQQSYDNQRSILEKEQRDFTDTTDAEIKSLEDKKSAIDATIQSLEKQWQQQDQNNKLTDLQNQLAQVMAQRNHEIVDASGNLTYTYDVQKVTDLQKQIADEQTTISHDAQKQQLEDQKSALDQQIQQLRDHQQQVLQRYQKQLQDLQTNYDNQRKSIEAYWQQRLSTGQLNAEAERMIAREGYKKALADANAFLASVDGAVSSAQSTLYSRGQDIAGQLGLIHNMAQAVASISASNPLPQSVLQNTSWVDPTLYRGRGRAYALATGGLIPSTAGIPNVDSVPAMLTPGEIVVPSWNDLMGAIKPAQSSNMASQTIHIEHLELPGVTDAQSFARNMEEYMHGAFTYTRGA